jgi:plastocyanin
MKRTLIALTIGLLLAGTFLAPSAQAGGGGHGAACPGGSSPVDATEVSLTSSCFGPQVAHVVTGSTLRWVNRDVMPHNITVLGQPDQPHALNANDTLTLTFSEAGAFAYYCAYHPSMVGLVLVGDDTPLAKAVVTENNATTVSRSTAPGSGTAPVLAKTTSANKSGDYGLLTVIGVAVAVGAISAGGTAVVLRRTASKREV